MRENLHLRHARSKYRPLLHLTNSTTSATTLSRGLMAQQRSRGALIELGPSYGALANNPSLAVFPLTKMPASMRKPVNFHNGEPSTRTPGQGSRQHFKGADIAH
jgi:hypothetical protein